MNLNSSQTTESIMATEASLLETISMAINDSQFGSVNLASSDSSTLNGVTMATNSTSTGQVNMDTTMNKVEVVVNHNWVGFASSASSDDVMWILVATFMILTMQTGFGLLEAGCISPKNEANIMIKNTCDLIVGGMSFWLVGFGFSFGIDNKNSRSYEFVGSGDYALTVYPREERMGHTYALFVMQLSFAAKATTIVSGAVAERTKLTSYIIFGFFNIITYCFPVHWIWGGGFLQEGGVVDIAGSGVVHLKGGVSALVAAIILGPRRGRYDRSVEAGPVTNGANVVVGTFLLWWGWLGFNAGSTLGVSGDLYQVTAKTAATTVMGSIGGGFFGLIFSLIFLNKGIYDVCDICNSVLGGLVAVTGTYLQNLVVFLSCLNPIFGGYFVAPCAVIQTWEAVIIGAIGAILAILSIRFLDRLRIDDPIGAVSVHGVAGIWGMLSVGFFMSEEPHGGLHNRYSGLFHGGGPKSLGWQALAVVCICVWSAVTSALLLLIINIVPGLGLRMTPENEEVGSDYTEHRLGPKAIQEFEKKMENRKSNIGKPSVSFWCLSLPDTCPECRKEDSEADQPPAYKANLPTVEQGGFDTLPTSDLFSFYENRGFESSLPTFLEFKGFTYSSNENMV